MHWCKMKIHGYLLDFYWLYIYNDTKICNIFTLFYFLYFCEYMNVEMLSLLHVVDFYRERAIYLIFLFKSFFSYFSYSSYTFIFPSDRISLYQRDTLLWLCWQLFSFLVTVKFCGIFIIGKMLMAHKFVKW